MNVTGVIAEYNPFHNGHFYHLQQTRLETDADFIIVLMSGDFVQRGEPAITDKWYRTKMALLGGADLVLELPCFAASGSAEYFARGSVSLLESSGVVSCLSFGSESGDLNALSCAASFFAQEPESYQMLLRQNLKKGMSFPEARQEAFSSYHEAEGSNNLLSLESILSSPNNLLGMEYLKALLRGSSSIVPHTVRRFGKGYHDFDVSSSTFGSASGIRKALSDHLSLESVRCQMPPDIFSVLTNSWMQSAPIFVNDFSSLLHYRLLSLTDQAQICSHYDISEDLADRILKIRSNFTSFSDFVALLKTRQITYTRASRCLLHLLLNMQQKTADSFFKDSAAYLRILGFRKSAGPLLAMMKKQCSVPVITKLANAKKILSPAAFSVLSQDLFCSDVYHAVAAQKYPGHKYNEYKISPVILP
ncbi:MAG: nucleotidyltransferase [Eubacteriales bacterium]|nr:nucleotidyltransferase [Eubacteriales bacterium]